VVVRVFPRRGMWCRPARRVSSPSGLPGGLREAFVGVFDLGPPIRCARPAGRRSAHIETASPSSAQRGSGVCRASVHQLASASIAFAENDAARASCVSRALGDTWAWDRQTETFSPPHDVGGTWDVTTS